MKYFYVLLILIITFSNLSSQSSIEYYHADEEGNLYLSRQGASHFASLALNCIQKEFPNKRNKADSMDLSPQQVHPAFYGCYDWHSSVHGHWMLIRLMKIFPNLPEKDLIIAMINQNLSKENILRECNYFQKLQNIAFERMYGWAWLLKLSEEIVTWDSPVAGIWARNLKLLHQFRHNWPVCQLPCSYKLCS